MISAELRLKLQKRLQLQQESEEELRRSPRFSPREDLNLGIEVPVLAGYYKANPQAESTVRRSGRTWSYQTSRPSLERSEDEEALSSEDLAAEVQELQELIEATNMQRDEARQKQHSIEATAVARSIELGAEVARLRINVEVLRRDLDAAQQEVRTSPSRRSRGSQSSRQEFSPSTDTGSDEVVAAQAEHDSLTVEVSRVCDERKSLADKVRCLEEEVAGSVVERARLEGLLRHCLLRESEAQRRVQALESAAVKKDGIGEFFALDLDDGDETETHKDLGDLELCYEDGLELSRLMPMQQALRLARGQNEAKETQKDTNQSTTASSSSASPMPVHEEDPEYFDAPLKALELALSRLRGGEEINGDIKDEGNSNGCEVTETPQSRKVSAAAKSPTLLKSDLVDLLTPRVSPHKELVKIPEPLGIQLMSPYALLGRRFTRIARHHEVR
jgi:hypothetical protein